MIAKRIRMEMRAVGALREHAAISGCSWRGGTSTRKALLVICDHPSDGRLLTLKDLQDAALQGLPTVAQAGNGPSRIDIADVIADYDTDTELPVLFVDEDDALSMFLYDIPA